MRHALLTQDTIHMVSSFHRRALGAKNHTDAEVRNTVGEVCDQLRYATRDREIMNIRLAKSEGRLESLLSTFADLIYTCAHILGS